MLINILNVSIFSSIISVGKFLAQRCKGVCIRMLTSVLFVIVENWKQKCPLGETDISIQCDTVQNEVKLDLLTWKKMSKIQ